MNEQIDLGGVPDLTRQRIYDAIVDLALEKGFRGTKLKMVLDHAGVGREEFERDFTNLEDCALRLFAFYVEDFTRTVEAAYAAHDNWPDALRAAGYATARWQREHPREVRFGSLELLAAGDMARAKVDATYTRFTDLIDAGRQELDDPDSVPRSTAEGIVGSLVMLLTKWLQGGGGTEGLEDLPDAYIQQAMYMAVLPYLGQEAAAKELEIPPPTEE